MIRRAFAFYAGVILGGPHGNFPINRQFSFNKEIKSKMPRMPAEFKKSVIGERAKTIIMDVFQGQETRKEIYKACMYYKAKEYLTK